MIKYANDCLISETDIDNVVWRSICEADCHIFFCIFWTFHLLITALLLQCCLKYVFILLKSAENKTGCEHVKAVCFSSLLLLFFIFNCFILSDRKHFSSILINRKNDIICWNFYCSIIATENMHFSSSFSFSKMFMVLQRLHT